MNWLNLELTTLRSEEYLGSNPVQRATWLNLLAYCADQENGGVIKSCDEWGSRRWLQLIGVTREEVLDHSALWYWVGGTVRVWKYPKAKEIEVKMKREKGKLGGRPPKTKADKPHGYEDGKPDGYDLHKRKGKEGNRKGIGKEVEGNENKPPVSPKGDSEFLAKFNEATGKNHRTLPDKASRQLKARIKEGYTVEDICKAAKTASESEHHKNSNLRNLTPEFITRGDKVDMWLNAPEKQNPEAGLYE